MALLSQDLAAMDFDSLQLQLAANEAKERKLLEQMHGGAVADGAAEGAANVRRAEFMSIAQSKMGKQQQLAELGERVAKEKDAAVELKSALAKAVEAEQVVEAVEAIRI